MPDDVQQSLASLFSEHMRQTHQDRRAQTAEFRQAIGELRTDIRILGALALLVLAALAGVQVVTRGMTLTPAPEVASVER
jgi:hypothetical protein